MHTLLRAAAFTLLSLMLASASNAQTTAATSGPAETASEPTGAPAKLASPRATMMTFLRAMERYRESGAFSQARADAVADIRATLDLSRAGPDAAEPAAAQLLGVLNRLGRVNPWDLPDREMVADRNMTEFVFFPDESRPSHRRLLAAGADGEIALSRGEGGVWRFSAATVAGVKSLYSSVDHMEVVYGADERTLSTALWLRSQVPAEIREPEFLAIELWQWLGLLVIVLAAVTVDYLVQALLRGLTIRRLRAKGHTVEGKTIARAVRPFGLFAGALFALGLLPALGLPALGAQILFTAVRFVLMVAGVLAAFRVVDVFTEVLAEKASGTQTKIDDLLVPLVRKSLKIFVAAIGVVYIAESLSIEILPLLTGLGIGGLAVAFAAKDTIENFFGSIAVIFDRPFEVGDWVVIDGTVEGTVEELGFRSTRVRTFYNSLVTVPNASLVRANVDNYGRRKYRRFTTKLGLAYDTPPEKIDAFCEGVRELVRQHPYTRKDYYHVYFNNYAAASLEILVYIFFEAPDWSVELRERHRFLSDVLRLADKLGVEFAYPTQTLYLKRGGASPGGEAPDFAELTDESRESEIVGRKLARSLTRRAGWRTERPGPVEFRGAAPVDRDPDDPDAQIEQRAAGG